MALTQQQKDARKADRINALRVRVWQDTTPSLFGDGNGPEEATAATVAEKRRRDAEMGRASLAKVADCQRQADEMADTMREVFALFRGRYLADLREASIHPDMRKHRWGTWEKHLHSIGVIAVGVMEDGTTWQVTAEREEGMAVFGLMSPNKASMMGAKR